MAYPKVKDTLRPIRIWDEGRKKNLRGCCYSILENAHAGAWREIRFYSKAGDIYTVYNISTSKPYSSYGWFLFPEDYAVIEQRGKPHIAVIDHVKIARKEHTYKT